MVHKQQKLRKIILRPYLSLDLRDANLSVLTPSVIGKASESFQIVPYQTQSFYLRVFRAIAPSVLTRNGLDRLSRYLAFRMKNPEENKIFVTWSKLYCNKQQFCCGNRLKSPENQRYSAKTDPVSFFELLMKIAYC